MSRAKRLREIIKSNNLTQRKFAESLKITESYVSMLLKDNDINISSQLLELIEKVYGYSADWIITGIEPKFSKHSKDINIPETNRRLISMVENLTPGQIKAVLAFINSLEEIEKSVKNLISSNDEEAPTIELNIPHPKIELVKHIPDEAKPVIIDGVELSPEDSKIIRNYWSNQQIKENNQEQQPKSKWDIETDRVIELAILQKEIDRQYNNPSGKERLSF